MGRGHEGNPKAFSTSPLWVQLWNLPVHWLTKEIGRKLGAGIGPVEEVIIPAGGSKEGRHLKLKVWVDISRSLL